MSRDKDVPDVWRKWREQRDRGGSVSIEQALKRWLKTNRVKQMTSQRGIFSRWSEVVGEALAAETRPVDLKHGELLIEVNSAPRLNELSTFGKDDLLETVRAFEEFRGVHEIRFRAGSF